MSLDIFMLSFLGFQYDAGFIKFLFLPNSLSWIKISTYGIMLALSFLVANFILQKECKRLNIEEKIADNIIIISIIGGIIGAKIFFVIETYEDWSGFSQLFDRLFSGAGLTWYGGLLLVLLSIWVYSKVIKIPVIRIFDICTPSLSLGYAVGRLGCVVSGDGCYGVKCPYNWPAPFAMAFPNGASPWQEIIDHYGDINVVVYNTPLFETMFSTLVFIFLWNIRKKTMPIGVMFFIYIGAHALFRFFIEFIRLNPRNVFGLSQAQFISLVLLTITAIFALIKIVDKKRS